MTEATRKAIIGLLAVDETASDAERERVARALKGEPPKVLKFSEVAERLGRTKQTVHNLVNAGLLERVPGAGAFSAGISEESFWNYVNNRGRKAVAV